MNKCPRCGSVDIKQSDKDGYSEVQPSGDGVNHEFFICKKCVLIQEFEVCRVLWSRLMDIILTAAE